MTILEFVDVTKSYRSGSSEVQALDRVSFRARPGEFLAVRGPSGSGKSTLLHLAGGLDHATSGQVLLGGRDAGTMTVAERAELRRRSIGFVFQRLNLIASLTAIENVMLPLELDGLRVREARNEARDTLGLVGLDHRLDRYPDDFSGGEQQRIAIARAVVGERRLLLADEPTGSLDSRTGDQVIEMLTTLARDRGATVVLVTHEPRYAAGADRVLSLRDGQIVGISEPLATAGFASRDPEPAR